MVSLPCDLFQKMWELVLERKFAGGNLGLLDDKFTIHLFFSSL